MTPFSWTSTLVASASTVAAAHILELRTALSDAYMAAGMPAPIYTDSSLGPGSLIRAVHINELRNLVTALD